MPILKVVLTDYWFDKIESGEKKTRVQESNTFLEKAHFASF